MASLTAALNMSHFPRSALGPNVENKDARRLQILERIYRRYGEELLTAHCFGSPFSTRNNTCRSLNLA